MIHLTDDDGVLCNDCAGEERERISNSIPGDGFHIINSVHVDNYSSGRVQCDHCYRILKEEGEEGEEFAAKVHSNQNPEERGGEEGQEEVFHAHESADTPQALCGATDSNATLRGLWDEHEYTPYRCLRCAEAIHARVRVMPE